MKQAAAHRARSEDPGAAVHEAQRAVVLETQHERAVTAVANQDILHDQRGAVHKQHIAALQRRRAREETVNAVRENPLTDTIEQEDSLTEDAALLALEMGKAVSLAQEEKAARLFAFISESAAVEAKAAARRQEMQEREADLVAREQAVERAAAEQQERQGVSFLKKIYILIENMTKYFTILIL